jgi:hypothetical protein
MYRLWYRLESGARRLFQHSPSIRGIHVTSYGLFSRPQFECRGACSLTILEPLLYICVSLMHMREPPPRTTKNQFLHLLYIAVANALLGEAKQPGAVSFGAGGHRSIPKTRFRIRVLDEAGMGQGSTSPCFTHGHRAGELNEYLIQHSFSMSKWCTIR